MIRCAIRSWSLLLVLLASAPGFAQEEPAADPSADAAAGPADGSVPYDGSGSEAAPATEAAPADATAEPVAADAAVETIPVESAAAEEPAPPAEEDGEPWNLYAGVDLVNTAVSTDGADASSGLYRLRFGRKLFDQIALEGHFGLDNGGTGAGEVSTDSYYGLYFVPMATMLDVVEFHFPIGYAMNKVGSRDLSSLAYGVNVELPLRTFGAELPDFRFGLGWMVYYQGTDARVYGSNFGLRYDFTTASLGNPFGWIGDIDLWPFGDDEAEATAE